MYLYVVYPFTHLLIHTFIHSFEVLQGRDEDSITLTLYQGNFSPER